MTETTSSGAPRSQSDVMLLIAAAAIVGMGVIWLVLSAPWSSPATAAATSPAFSVQPAALTGAPSQSAQVPGPERSGRGLANSLRLAQLAYEAGMLVEPEEYSAWNLFLRALEEDATSEAAKDGLDRLAEDLLARGAVAVEQGRYDDASATAARILDALPDHAGAMALAANVRTAQPQPERPTPTVVRPEPEASARASEPRITPARSETRAEPAAPAADPLDGLAESFMSAMAANELLRPADRSARHYVEAMLAADADDPRTRDSRDLLVTELLSRSNQALEALDWEAATTWVDEAERIAGDPGAIVTQRERLAEGLIAMESARPIPASDLTIRNYVPPEYPRSALTRGIEGWVDIEFTVGMDGRTRDVVVAHTSHNRYFRDEALEAVTAWVFEPRVFMDRAIEQRSFTRLRFELDN